MVISQTKPNLEQHSVPATVQHGQALSLGLAAARSGYGLEAPGTFNTPGASTGGNCLRPQLLFASPYSKKSDREQETCEIHGIQGKRNLP